MALTTKRKWPVAGAWPGAGPREQGGGPSFSSQHWHKGTEWSSREHVQMLKSYSR